MSASKASDLVTFNVSLGRFGRVLLYYLQLENDGDVYGSVNEMRQIMKLCRHRVYVCTYQYDMYMFDVLICTDVIYIYIYISIYIVIVCHSS